MKIDLKDAYLHVPINEEFQPFLAFQWGTKFMFKALPFGLCLAPAVLQGIMNFPVRKLRERGIYAMAYLDDWLVWADSKEKCQSDIHTLAQELSSLGFILNQAKSQMTPSQRISRLGADCSSNPFGMIFFKAESSNAFGPSDFRKADRTSLHFKEEALRNCSKGYRSSSHITSSSTLPVSSS